MRVFLIQKLQNTKRELINTSDSSLLELFERSPNDAGTA